MNIFEFDSYKDLVRARVSQMPKAGRGEYTRIAAHLQMHTTRVSQIFKGSEQLSLEQACSLARYLGLNELETEYFLLLVQLERSGSAELTATLRKQQQQIRARAAKLAERLPKDVEFGTPQKAIFYSNWFYSGVRLACSLPEIHSVDAIAERLELPRNVVAEVVEFLLGAGLCKMEDGKIRMGPARTHLESDSLLVSRLHANWRLKALERHSTLGPQELGFTAPMSIAAGDVSAIRELLIKTIERVSALASRSEAEELACLNIDWFRF